MCCVISPVMNHMTCSLKNAKSTSRGALACMENFCWSLANESVLEFTSTAVFVIYFYYVYVVTFCDDCELP